MTSKTDFNVIEWKSILNAPHWIYKAFQLAERGGLLTKRKEAKALASYLEDNKSSNALVKAIIADQDAADDSLKGNLEEAEAAIAKVGALLDEKAADSDGDAVRSFLLGSGKAIAEAVRETRGLRNRDQMVSAKEEEILERLEVALKATTADARRRRSAAAAARGKTTAAKPKAATKAAAATGAAAMSAADKAKQKAEVEARAAARRAQQETDKSKDQLKAEVEARAEARRAKVTKEAAESKANTAMEAALARKKEAQVAAKRQAAAARAEEAKEAAEARVEEARIKRDAIAKRVEAKAKMTKYTIKSGDTLSGISLAHFGTANRWREIYEANKDTIGANPNLIRVGMELNLPANE